MIAALTGQLSEVAEPHVHVQVGPIVYELLVPAADLESLRAGRGQEVTLHTLLYLEGDPNRGNLEPRLIGFLRPEDKKFFELFTTVKGIGPKTALRALTVPVGEIAQAIELRDNKFLVELDGIGKRTAELIIAELGGKMQKFVTGAVRAPLPGAGRRLPVEEDAIGLLVAGGASRSEAEILLARVRVEKPELKTTQDLWREMLRLR